MSSTAVINIASATPNRANQSALQCVNHRNVAFKEIKVLWMNGRKRLSRPSNAAQTCEISRVKTLRYHVLKLSVLCQKVLENRVQRSSGPSCHQGLSDIVFKETLEHHLPQRF